MLSVIRILPAILLVTFSTNLGAQSTESDLIKQAKMRQAILEQQLHAEVKQAIEQAKITARVSTTKAKSSLLKLRLRVDILPGISAQKRSALVAMIIEEVAAFDRATGNNAPVHDPKLEEVKKQNREKFEQALKEVRDVNEAIKKIKEYQDKNRFREADLEIQRIAKLYPANAATLFLAGQGTFADRLARAAELTREMDRRFVAVQNGIARSALPIGGDGTIEYPANWKEIQERRKKLQPKLFGPEEEKILQSLEKAFTKPLKDVPLEEAMQIISNLIDQNIYIDQSSLEDLGLDLKKPVSTPQGVVSARTALRATLQSIGLTFIVKDKILQVVSVEKASRNMMTRAYDLRDIITIGGPFNNAVQWGPQLDFLQTAQNANFLMDAIKRSVDPTVWSNRGVSITFSPATLSIIVRAPSEVHYSLGNALK